MANFKFLIGALCFLAGSTWAGYAQVSPPPTWSGSAGWWYKPAVNDVSFSGGVRGASGVINVAGRPVVMPAAYRFAPNAARFAASAAFGNPALFLGLGAASLAYKWYLDSDLEVVNGVWKKKTAGLPAQGACYTAPCYEYLVGINGITNNTWAGSVAAAAGIAANAHNAQFGQYWMMSYLYQVNASTVRMRSTCNNCAASGYPTGYYTDSNQGLSQRSASPLPPPETQYDVLTRQQFEDEMAPKTVPNGVPQSWPLPDSWPVEIPILNPTPVNPTAPNAVPTPQPLRVPQGDPIKQPLPVPNPENVPETWKTPVIDLVPSPTENDPWRVDAQPKDIITESPSPLPETAPVPVTPPDGQVETPTEKPPGLCDEYPDILACQKTDTPESDPLDKVDKSATVEMNGGWGGSGSCPAPRHINGANFDFSFTPFCDALTMFKPLVLAMAWLSAAFILVGARGGD